MESKIIAITGINNSSYTSQFATNNTNSAKKADGEKEIVFSAVGSDIKHMTEEVSKKMDSKTFSAVWMAALDVKA